MPSADARKRAVTIRTHVLESGLLVQAWVAGPTPGAVMRAGASRTRSYVVGSNVVETACNITPQVRKSIARGLNAN